MPNNSQTGGYLVPSSLNGNLDDKLFYEFMQPVVVGITALPGSMVRRRWQPESPNLPDYGTNWASIGLVNEDPDALPYTYHTPASGDVEGFDSVFQNQVMKMLCSFYGPSAGAYANLLVLGFTVSQNREAMLLQGYSFLGNEKPIITAELINEKWTKRVDVPFEVRRGVTFSYPVYDLDGIQVEIVNDEGVPALNLNHTPTHGYPA
jgi:hypothetical protein